MTEEIRHDYEARSEGAGPHWEIPYARLTDTTPTPSNPAEVTSLTDGCQLTGTILTIDAGDSVAVIDFTPGQVYYHEVRNVLTYAAAVEATWGAINIGDEVYYDHSATMPAGVYLSTSPLSNTGANNTRFGWIVSINDTDMALYPKGGITASTQDCGVMQLGAGSAAT
jgi:hypothetical protein